MAHQQLAQNLESLAAELKAFLGANPFELQGIDHVVPFDNQGKLLRPGHDGCYLAITRGRNYSTISFELRLDLSTFGKAEMLVLQGRYIDMRYAGDRYERWFQSPHANPYLLDILDRVDRMAAHALRYLEKAARESLGNPEFQLLTAVPSSEVYAVVAYFREPVQIDHVG